MHLIRICIQSSLQGNEISNFLFTGSKYSDMDGRFTPSVPVTCETMFLNCIESLVVFH